VRCEAREEKGSERTLEKSSAISSDSSHLARAISDYLSDSCNPQLQQPAPKQTCRIVALNMSHTTPTPNNGVSLLRGIRYAMDTFIGGLVCWVETMTKISYPPSADNLKCPYLTAVPETIISLLCANNGVDVNGTGT